MAHIPYNSERSIVKEFERYYSGDGVIPGYGTYNSTRHKTAATNTFINLLRLKYGNAASFILSGPGIDSNGLLSSALFNQFNNTLKNIANTPPTSPTAAQIQTAFNAITSQVYVTVIYPTQPTYEYPWYYENRFYPYSTLDRFEFNSKQIQNLKYLGSKLTGTAINVDSSQTSDGGPVVKVSKVNQNQIIFSNNNITTARANISGLPVRQLTARTGTTSGRTTQGSSSQTGGINTGNTGSPPID